MAKFPTYEEMGKKVAEEALDGFVYKDKTLREWIDILSSSENTNKCEDAISRHDAIRLADELKDDLPDDEQMADIVTAHNEGISEYQTKLSLLPSVIPKQKMGHWIPLRCDMYDCSECDRTYTSFKLGTCDADFCPGCGAKMRESEIAE